MGGRLIREGSANLLIFFVVFRVVPQENSVWIGRIFFIWVSVFNLFVISVFWSFMTDIYRSAQSKRLFGMLEESEERLALAALLDEIVDMERGGDQGQLIAGGASSHRGEGVVQEVARTQREVIGGGVLEGITDVLRSPYLIGIAVLMLLFTVTSTYLYFMQAEIVEGSSQDSRVRTQLFANIDLIVNILTLVTQLFLTGRILRWPCWWCSRSCGGQATMPSSVRRARCSITCCRAARSTKPRVSTIRLYTE